jgi:hypothetical protein
MHVRVGQLQGKDALLTHATWLDGIDGGVTYQTLRQPEGDPLLADAKRPLEEEGLWEPAGGNCLPEPASQGVVAVDLV